MSSFSKIFFHGELQDFLQQGKGIEGLNYQVNRKASIKDVIESLGPPHTEIERILVNGMVRDFTHILRPGDIVEVHPHTPPVDIAGDSELKPGIKDKTRFIVDVNVGKMAKLLRMLGYDAAYNPNWSDREIADLAQRENRIVLTKDRGLLKRSKIAWGRLLRSSTPQEQFRETASFFGLSRQENPFSRCLCCNTELEPVKKSEILHLLEPKTKMYFQSFYRCPSCRRIYWQGSHHKRMQAWLSMLDKQT